jgi:hypothetical protein
MWCCADATSEGSLGIQEQSDVAGPVQSSVEDAQRRDGFEKGSDADGGSGPWCSTGRFSAHRCTVCFTRPRVGKRNLGRPQTTHESVNRVAQAGRGSDDGCDQTWWKRSRPLWCIAVVVVGHWGACQPQPYRETCCSAGEGRHVTMMSRYLVLHA